MALGQAWSGRAAAGLLAVTSLFAVCTRPALHTATAAAASAPTPAARECAAFAARPGPPVRRHFNAGGADCFAFELAAAEFLLLRVEQLGVDVKVAVADPAGWLLFTVDGLDASLGPERVPLVAPRAGIYRLTVLALDGEAGGDYEVHVERRHQARKGDFAHAEGAALVAVGDGERQRTEVGAAERAIALYRQAAGRFAAAEAVREEAMALRKLSLATVVGNRGDDGLAPLEAALRLVGRGDSRQRAAILGARGQILRRSGRRAEARVAFVRAIEAAAGAAPLEEAAAWNNLANLKQEEGQLSAALVGYDRALALWRRHGRRRAEATALHNLGALCQELNRLPEAEAYLRRSLRLQGATGPAGARALTWTVLGQVYSWQGAPLRALVAYRRAMALGREGGDRATQALLLGRLGGVYLELGHAEHALALTDRGIALTRTLGQPSRLAWALGDFGWLREHLGQTDLALALYAEAEVRFRALHDRTGEAGACYGAARILRLHGERAAAAAKLECALAQIEDLRAEAPGPALRRSFLASRQAVYETYIDLLMEVPTRTAQARALEIVERSRARSRLDALGSHTAAGRRLGDSLLRRGRRIVERLEALEVARLAGARADGVETEQARLLLEREVLRAHLQVGDHQQLPKPVTLAAIRRLLDGETHLLVYSLGERRSFLWWVGRESWQTFELPGRCELEPLARAAWELLEAGRGGVQTKLVLERLSRSLLQPVADRLGTNRLVVVADGALRYLPFGALPDFAADGAPLLARHEIVYADSASVLALERQLTRRPAPPLDLAVVADPVFQASDRRVGLAAAPVALPSDLRRTAADLGVADFGRLPYSGREAASLLALVPSDRRLSALGFAASRQMVLSGRLSRYRVVHFATHALVHPTLPELSGLVLSLVDARGHAQPGFVHAYELQDLDLPADLVVLSACRTALGREVPGEGLVGLSQAFSRVPRRVLSLWSVEDLSTAELMTRFYAAMWRDHLRPAAALRQAQLSMLREPTWSDPHHWAGFVYQGEWR